MLLYKYKPANQLQHLLDITVNERLFCQQYSKLNDPFEGQFRSLVLSGGSIVQPIAQPIVRSIVQPIVGGPPISRTVFRDVGELPFKKTRVCSLSSTPSDVRMWSLYADSHQGIAIELDLTGLEDQLHKVRYEPDLPKFGSPLLTNPTAVDVLTRKTYHWSYEEEYRIIGDEMHFSIANKITRVILGIRSSPELELLLLNTLRPSIPITKAELDHDGVCIRFGKDISRLD